MKRILVIGASALVVGAGMFAFAFAGSPKVTSPMRIHVIEVPATDEVIDTGVAGDTAGDLLTFHNKLFQPGRSGAIGRDQGQCIRIDPVAGTWECSWTNALPDGHISVTGPFNDNHNSVLTVTGGTGKYRNARGTMVLRFRDGGNFDFVFNLVP